MTDSRRRQTEIGSYFVRQYRGQWLTLGMVSLLLIAVIDYATGFALRFTVLYLVPLLIDRKSVV